jgi:hypothetical protein
MAGPLFDLPELVSYMQVPELDTLTATLARDLATAEIRLEVGTATYDLLTDVSAFKGVALSVAKRIVLNPSGLRSTAQQIDDYSETNTYAAESLGEAVLTDAERDKIARIMGRTSGFTIRPASDGPFRTYPRTYLHHV